MSVVVDLAMFPVDKGEHLSPYVSRAVRIIRQSGLPYTFGPMGTSIEGEWDEVMNVVSLCFQAMSDDCHRIYMTIKADYQKDAENRLSGKIKSVEEKLRP